MRVMAAALELRGEQQMPLKLFLASCSSSQHAAHAVLEAPWLKSSRNIDLENGRSF